jgi:hypothetical protein
MAIKYTNIFHCKPLKKLPKFGLLVWKYAIWQPWRGLIVRGLTWRPDRSVNAAVHPRRRRRRKRRSRAVFSQCTNRVRFASRSASVIRPGVEKTKKVSRGFFFHFSSVFTFLGHPVASQPK